MCQGFENSNAAISILIIPMLDKAREQTKPVKKEAANDYQPLQIFIGKNFSPRKFFAHNRALKKDFNFKS